MMRRWLVLMGGGVPWGGLAWGIQQDRKFMPLDTPYLCPVSSQLTITAIDAKNISHGVEDKRFAMHEAPKGKTNLNYRSESHFYYEELLSKDPGAKKITKKLYVDDQFLPLTLIANLSLEATWKQIFKKVLLRRVVPRWKAFFMAMLGFRDQLVEELKIKEEFEGAMLLLGGTSCYASAGEDDRVQDFLIDHEKKISDLKDKHHPYFGAEPGLRGEWSWDDVIKLGKLQLECGMLRYSLDAGNAHTYASLLKSHKILEASLRAKLGDAGDFLALLKLVFNPDKKPDKKPYTTWRFKRHRNGMFGRFLSWIASKLRRSRSTINPFEEMATRLTELTGKKIELGFSAA